MPTIDTSASSCWYRVCCELQQCSFVHSSSNACSFAACLSPLKLLEHSSCLSTPMPQIFNPHPLVPSQHLILRILLHPLRTSCRTSLWAARSRSCSSLRWRASPITCTLGLWRWADENEVNCDGLVEELGVVGSVDCGAGFVQGWVFDECVTLFDLLASILSSFDQTNNP